MHSWLRAHRYVPFILSVAACGGEPTGIDPGVAAVGSCQQASPALTPSVLGVGEHIILDPADANGCVRIPAVGAAGAEHLYLALSAAGEQTGPGIKATYRIGEANPAAPVTSEGELLSPLVEAFAPPATAEQFHAMLRARERALSADPTTALFQGKAAEATAEPVRPVAGQQRTFKVCASISCRDFADVAATVQEVSQHVAIYLDDAVPPGGYTPADIDSVARLFDSFLYPIDTTAFGRESDIDNNGVVLVLLTDQVNQFSPNCRAAGSVVLGYFFGSDLVPSARGSNRGEIFYALVPDPNNSACDIGRSEGVRRLAPTFIHELQHMISYNQHRLQRQGLSEDIWLNEGLSHYAEELGARQVPDEPLSAPGTRFSQFVTADLANAYRYLVPDSLEATFLVTPGNSTGTLRERGANWLFVRWLADHFGGTTTPAFLATGLTRRLVETNLLGDANVAAVAGEDFSSLVAQWQMANYLDDLPGFTPASDRLQYLSWNFRATLDSLSLARSGRFGTGYPLVPDSTRDGSYLRRGVLRAGSGRHLRVIQDPSAAAVDVQLTDSLGNRFSSEVVPRIGLVRIR